MNEACALGGQETGSQHAHGISDMHEGFRAGMLFLHITACGIPVTKCEHDLSTRALCARQENGTAVARKLVLAVFVCRANTIVPTQATQIWAFVSEPGR